MIDNLDILKTMADSPGDSSLGKVDRYLLIEKVGEGSFGGVFKALDEVSGLEVAIKALPTILASSPESMEAVRANFQLTSKLKHPNIASLNIIHKVEKVDSAISAGYLIAPGDYLVVMDFAEGATLQNYSLQFPDRRVPIDEALDIVRKVADALDYAHRQKVVHRDVKLENVIINLDTKEIKLLDFGLAKEISSNMSRLTNSSGSNSGTRPYMAPEQWEGKRQTEKTDQYSLSVLLYELINGEVPFWSVFNTDDLALQMNVVGSKTPQPISSLSKIRNQVLLKGLSKNPDDRFANCSDLVVAFEQEKMPRSKKKTKTIGIALGIVAVLAIAGGITAVMLSQGRPEPKVSNKLPQVDQVTQREQIPVVEQKDDVELLPPVAEGSFKAAISSVTSGDGPDSYVLGVDKGRMHGVRDVIKAELRLSTSDILLGKGRVYFRESDYSTCTVQVQLSGAGTDYSLSANNKDIFYIKFPYPADHFEPDYRAYDQLWDRGDLKQAQETFSLIGEKWHTSPEYTSRQEPLQNTLDYMKRYESILSSGTFAQLVQLDKTYRDPKASGISSAIHAELSRKINQLTNQHTAIAPKLASYSWEGAVADYQSILKTGAFSDLTEKMQGIQRKLSDEKRLLKELESNYLSALAGKRDFRELEAKLDSVPESTLRRKGSVLVSYNKVLLTYLGIRNSFSGTNAKKLKELPSLSELLESLEKTEGSDGLKKLFALESAFNEYSFLKASASSVTAVRKQVVPEQEERWRKQINDGLKAGQTDELKQILAEIEPLKAILSKDFLSYREVISGNVRYIGDLADMQSHVVKNDYVRLQLGVLAIRKRHENQPYFKPGDIQSAEEILGHFSYALGLLSKADQLYETRDFAKAAETYKGFLSYIQKNKLTLSTDRALAKVKACEDNIRQARTIKLLGTLKNKLNGHRFGQSTGAYRTELKKIISMSGVTSSPAVKMLSSQIEKLCNDYDAQFKRVTASKALFDSSTKDYQKKISEANTLAQVQYVYKLITALNIDRKFDEAKLFFKPEMAMTIAKLQDQRKLKVAEITKRLLDEKRAAYINSLSKRLSTLITNFDDLKQGDLPGFNRVERNFKSLTAEYSNLFNEKFSSSIANGKFKSRITKLSKVRKSAWQVVNHRNATDFAP